MEALQLLPPLLQRGRLHLAAPLQGGRLRHPLRRRRGQTALGQRRPVLRQEQRDIQGLHVQDRRRQAGPGPSRRRHYGAGQQ